MDLDLQPGGVPQPAQQQSGNKRKLPSDEWSEQERPENWLLPANYASGMRGNEWISCSQVAVGAGGYTAGQRSAFQTKLPLTCKEQHIIARCLGVSETAMSWQEISSKYLPHRDPAFLLACWIKAKADAEDAAKAAGAGASLQRQLPNSFLGVHAAVLADRANAPPNANSGESNVNFTESMWQKIAKARKAQDLPALASFQVEQNYFTLDDGKAEVAAMLIVELSTTSVDGQGINSAAAAARPEGPQAKRRRHVQPSGNGGGPSRAPSAILLPSAVATPPTPAPYGMKPSAQGAMWHRPAGNGSGHGGSGSGSGGSGVCIIDLTGPSKLVGPATPLRAAQVVVTASPVHAAQPMPPTPLQKQGPTQPSLVAPRTLNLGVEAAGVPLAPAMWQQQPQVPEHQRIMDMGAGPSFKGPLRLTAVQPTTPAAVPVPERMTGGSSIPLQLQVLQAPHGQEDAPDPLDIIFDEMEGVCASPTFATAPPPAATHGAPANGAATQPTPAAALLPALPLGNTLQAPDLEQPAVAPAPSPACPPSAASCCSQEWGLMVDDDDEEEAWVGAATPAMQLRPLSPVPQSVGSEWGLRGGWEEEVYGWCDGFAERMELAWGCRWKQDEVGGWAELMQ